MTQTEIEILTGRDLDFAVAEHVLGWQRWAVPGGLAYLLEAVPAYSSWQSAGPEVPLSQHAGDYVPYFSADMLFAWQLVERFGLAVIHSEDGWYAIAPEDLEHDGYVRGADFPTLTLIGREGERWEPAASAPVAICRTALLVAARLKGATE